MCKSENDEVFSTGFPLSRCESSCHDPLSCLNIVILLGEGKTRGVFVCRTKTGPRGENFVKEESRHYDSISEMRRAQRRV